VARRAQGQPGAEAAGVRGERQPKAGPDDVPDERWCGRVADDGFDRWVASWGSSAFGSSRGWTRSLSLSVAAASNR
jgi:hypothetical protein